MRGGADEETSGWADGAGAPDGVWEKRGRTWAKVLFVVALVGLGFFQGLHMADAPDTPVAYQHGQLVATDALKQALYDPSTRARGGGPAAGAEYANEAGETCRRFVHRELRGSACQQDGDWRIVEMRQGVADPDAGVVPARPAVTAGPTAPRVPPVPAALPAPKQQEGAAENGTGN